VLARNSGIAIWPSANFHHPPGRNFLLQSQTKPVLVKYTIGPIQIRGMGTMQLSMRLRFILL
jgi:hypothetical protein